MSLIWGSVMFLDTQWRHLIYGLSDKLLAFYLNGLSDTLPTPANLKLWKMTKLGVCALCKYNHCTLSHILNNCRVSLKSLRYNWRHDMVLRRLVAQIQPYLGVKRTRPTPRQFCTVEGKKYQGPVPIHITIHESLPEAADWQVLWDEDHRQYVFPSHIANTPARPDITIWSDTLKVCVLAELTVCWEENFQSAHERKSNKQLYTSLMTEGEINGWSMKYFPVEVGSRGVASSSILHFYRYVGMSKEPPTLRPMKYASLL